MFQSFIVIKKIRPQYEKTFKDPIFLSFSLFDSHFEVLWILKGGNIYWRHEAPPYFLMANRGNPPLFP